MVEFLPITHTITSIGPAIEQVQALVPKAGLLCQGVFSLSGFLKLILHYMNLHHQADVQAHKSRCLKRSVYWTTGPFSGCILWIKIWWTNCNPHLICGWYCDTVQALGTMPLVTQSDPGSENNGITNGHTSLRHMQDPALACTLQHKFKGQHRNIKPEIFWSQL
ncbi:hypothetical protein F4604DRAFT_1882446 [Suillus subluteus]|nr:hypothetical protein F4604DRAFT_1882446 [Suillus subluteus]